MTMVEYNHTIFSSEQNEKQFNSQVEHFMEMFLDIVKITDSLSKNSLREFSQSDVALRKAIEVCHSFLHGNIGKITLCKYLKILCLDEFLRTLKKYLKERELRVVDSFVGNNIDQVYNLDLMKDVNTILDKENMKSIFKLRVENFLSFLENISDSLDLKRDIKVCKKYLGGHIGKVEFCKYFSHLHEFVTSLKPFLTERELKKVNDYGF